MSPKMFKDRSLDGKSLKPESPITRRTENTKQRKPDNPIQIQFGTGVGRGGIGHRVTPPIPMMGQRQEVLTTASSIQRRSG